MLYRLGVKPYWIGAKTLAALASHMKRTTNELGDAMVQKRTTTAELATDLEIRGAVAISGLL